MLAPMSEDAVGRTVGVEQALGFSSIAHASLKPKHVREPQLLSRAGLADAENADTCRASAAAASAASLSCRSKSVARSADASASLSRAAATSAAAATASTASQQHGMHVNKGRGFTETAIQLQPHAMNTDRLQAAVGCSPASGASGSSLGRSRRRLIAWGPSLSRRNACEHPTAGSF